MKEEEVPRQEMVTQQTMASRKASHRSQRSPLDQKSAPARGSPG